MQDLKDINIFTEMRRNEDRLKTFVPLTGDENYKEGDYVVFLGFKTHYDRSYKGDIFIVHKMEGEAVTLKIISQHFGIHKKDSLMSMLKSDIVLQIVSKEYASQFTKD